MAIPEILPRVCLVLAAILFMVWLRMFLKLSLPSVRLWPYLRYCLVFVVFGGHLVSGVMENVLEAEPAVGEIMTIPEIVPRVYRVWWPSCFWFEGECSGSWPCHCQWAYDHTWHIVSCLSCLACLAAIFFLSCWRMFWKLSLPSASLWPYLRYCLVFVVFGGHFVSGLMGNVLEADPVTVSEIMAIPERLPRVCRVWRPSCLWFDGEWSGSRACCSQPAGPCQAQPGSSETQV